MRSRWSRLSKLPAQAVIAVATSSTTGQVHLEFSAHRAASYDVLRKAPGETDFSVIAADIIETTYDANGLAAGSYDFKVVGRNSRGEGPESDVSNAAVG